MAPSILSYVHWQKKVCFWDYNIFYIWPVLQIEHLNLSREEAEQIVSMIYIQLVNSIWNPV